MAEQVSEQLGRIIEDLSPYLSSCLNSLGYLGHEVEKEDLLQEIRIRIWKACRSKGDNFQYFNAYVKRIVFSVFINEFNRLKKEKLLLKLAENSTSRDEGAARDNPVSYDHLKKALVASLGTLKEAKRGVIMLRLEGFTFADIARLNKWTYRKTCNIYYRGIEDLKRKLREEGIDYED